MGDEEGPGEVGVGEFRRDEHADDTSTVPAMPWGRCRCANPIAVVARALRPGGVRVVAVSNRMFPGKAIRT